MIHTGGEGGTGGEGAQHVGDMAERVLAKMVAKMVEMIMVGMTMVVAQIV